MKKKTIEQNFLFKIYVDHLKNLKNVQCFDVEKSVRFSESFASRH